MNSITAYLKGVQATCQTTRIWLWLYLINLFVALLVIMPLYTLMEDKIGYSLQAPKLLDGFNYTIYQDFMNEYGDAVFLVLGQSQFFILIFMVLYVFLTGGILSVFQPLPERLNLSSFGAGCAHFFGRFLRLAIYFLLMQAGLLAFFVVIYWSIVDMSSDKSIMDTLFVLMPIFLLLSSVIMMVHDYAKIQVVHSDDKWLMQPIKNAFQLTFTHFFKTAGLYGLNLLTFIGIFGIYWLIKSNVPSNSGIGILMVFVLGQIFLVARIGLKLLNLSSATVLNQAIMADQ